MKTTFLFFSILIFSLAANGYAEPSTKLEHLFSNSHIIKMDIPERVALDLEFANQTNKIAWGLMGRKNLPRNTGMLFSYSTPQILSFWMFNTYIDLSIAFLDEHHVIREIKDLQAFPEQMQAYKGPLPEPKILKRLPLEDPVVDFFFKRQVYSSFPGSFALEVNRDWFTKHHIAVGDVVLWKQARTHATIMRSLDISQISIDNDRPTLLVFTDEGPLSVWFSKDTMPREVSMLDKKGITIKDAPLETGHVLYTETAVKYLLLYPLTN